MAGFLVPEVWCDDDTCTARVQAEHEATLEQLRASLAASDWRIDNDRDLCPDHAGTVAAAVGHPADPVSAR